MRFTLMSVIVVLYAQNAFAQPADPATPTAQPPATPSPTPPTVDPRIDQCVSNGGGEACCGGLVACQNVQAQLGQERREQMDTAANAYGESPEQYGRRLCRSIGGTWGDLWDGSDWKKNCECHSPREWDESHEFCLPDNADYLERVCLESDGRWTGGRCDCGGRQMDGGRCTGLNRIELLESQLTTAQALARNLGEQLSETNTDLAEARADGQTQATDLEELERRYNDLDSQLRDALRRIAYLEGRLAAEGESVPETTPGAATEPIPGAAAATAEVAIGSTTPPVGQVPTVEEDDESSCGTWCIIGIVAGGVAVGLGVWAIVESQTTYSIINNP
jgi:hypothetical protein